MKIHFIGICGVAMGGLALALKKAGHEITGSDKGFFPPISTYLTEHGISYYPGWHPEKMCANGVPDLVVVGNVANSTNPEWLYVLQEKIHYASYPELIEKFFLKKNSIVCAGTYGKTSSTALMSAILGQVELDPSYMFGGLSTETIPSAYSGKGSWSILEGDEYKTSKWDNSPKFNHYKPTHLLLTAVEWDHADIYPTEADYIHAFEKLVSSVPTKGLIVLSSKVRDMKKFSKARVLTYGPEKEVDYRYNNIEETKEGLTFTIEYEGESIEIKSPLIGRYQVENITGCFALAHAIGIDPTMIQKAIYTHHGLKRRMEKRCDGRITIIDDIAHSPAKAASVLQTLKKLYSGKIIAVFEPNTGNRQESAIPQYAHAFLNATTVIIPRLSIIKTKKTEENTLLDGEKIAEVIKKTHPDVSYIGDDAELITDILQETSPGDVIAFLGSHGFRGMIEELVKVINSKY